MDKRTKANYLFFIAMNIRLDDLESDRLVQYGILTELLNEKLIRDFKAKFNSFNNVKEIYGGTLELTELGNDYLDNHFDDIDKKYTEPQ